jgi:hypothetical protein
MPTGAGGRERETTAAPDRARPMPTGGGERERETTAAPERPRVETGEREGEDGRA